MSVSLVMLLDALNAYNALFTSTDTVSTEWVPGVKAVGGEDMQEILACSSNKNDDLTFYD